MKLVVVGGHSRNIGKTSVVAAVIAATRELGWTALKLTQFGHNLCSTDGQPCDCAVNDPLHPFSITREADAGGASDTSRFLAAGALEAYWVRTPQGELGAAMPEIRRLISERPYVIMESNSVLRFARPDLYVVVLDPRTGDFKASARENLDRADAFIIANAERANAGRPGAGETSPSEPAAGLRSAAWESVPLSLLQRRPVFQVTPPVYFPPELMPLLRAKLVS